jgi:hypothetical protein
MKTINNLIENYRGMRLDCGFRLHELQQKKAKAGHDPRLTLKQRREKIDELEWIEVATQSEMRVIYMIIEDLENL